MIKLERVVGFEPTSSAWKAEAQPLYHTRVRGKNLAGTVGLEPTTIRLTAERSTTELHPNMKLVACGRLELP